MYTWHTCYHTCFLHRNSNKKGIWYVSLGPPLAVSLSLSLSRSLSLPLFFSACPCISMHVCMYVSGQLCMYVCMYVSRYVCMCLCMHICVYRTEQQKLLVTLFLHPGLQQSSLPSTLRPPTEPGSWGREAVKSRQGGPGKSLYLQGTACHTKARSPKSAPIVAEKPYKSKIVGRDFRVEKPCMSTASSDGRTALGFLPQMHLALA